MSLQDATIREFLKALAAKTPTPGGGAVAGLLAALSASLSQMVVNYSIGKKKFAEHDALHQQALAQLQSICERSLVLVDADAAAYARLNDLLKLDKGDPIRQQELARAVEEASEPAWQILLACKECLILLEKLCGRTSAMLRSDLAIAATLAEAASRAAWWNVHVNLPLIENNPAAQELAHRVDATLESIAQLAKTIEAACKSDK